MPLIKFANRAATKYTLAGIADSAHILGHLMALRPFLEALMRHKLLGAALGLSLVFGANSAAFAEEQPTPTSMSAHEVMIDGQSARIVAFDQTGAPHIIVLDLSALSAAERAAVERAAGMHVPEATGQAAGGVIDDDNTIVQSGSQHSVTAAGAYGQPGDATVSGDGHATDSSNNVMGDVSEGLSNQAASSDESDMANGDQPNQQDVDDSADSGS